MGTAGLRVHGAPLHMLGGGKICHNKMYNLIYFYIVYVIPSSGGITHIHIVNHHTHLPLEPSHLPMRRLRVP